MHGKAVTVDCSPARLVLGTATKKMSVLSKEALWIFSIADAVNGFQAKVTYDGEEGPVAIPLDAPASLSTQAVVSSVQQDNSNDDNTVTIVDARQQKVQAVAAPTIVRAVPQQATLVAAAQPELIQVNGGAQVASLSST